MIQFPIIRRLEVKDYELFRNANSTGISHLFEKGVHAVVGINGLGKTTLLVILYRALLGPNDQSKSDDAGLLGSQHKLSDWRNKSFFRDRVPDHAVNATVEIDVEFGKALITIRRQLKNLQIEYLAINGITLDAKTADGYEEAYENAVVEHCGVANFFDFFALLRYLVFFLEDRIELIWDRRSQFDMLRVLLFDTEAAKATSQAYDDAQSADSRYRNRRAILGKDKKRLAEAEAALGDTQASQFRAMQAAIFEAEEKDRDQAKNIEQSKEVIEEARLRRERALLDLQEARTALEYEEQAHYKDLFPTLDQNTQHIVLNLLSGGGCLLCGSVGADVADHLRSKLEEHRCPVCDSPSERHEKVTTPADFSRARLKKLKQKVDQLRQSVIVCTSEIDAAEDEHEKLIQRREEDRTKLRGLRLEMNRLGFSELPSQDELDSLRSAVKEGDKELLKLLSERTEAENRYGKIVRRQKNVIEETVGAIKKRFRHYAGLVLAERCELNVATESRSIGEEGTKFDFPYFEVMMTSGVFDQSLNTRNNKEAVSESQGEFLDIAFRLSLIDAVTNRSGNSMMVVETPESSLDSLFVAMAGEAFRFYGENPNCRNVFIASMNLNNEEMLSALLGITKPPKIERGAASEPKLRGKQSQIRTSAPIVPAADRKKRVINLLELAAPNAALKQHRAYYSQLLKNALGQGRRS